MHGGFASGNLGFWQLSIKVTFNQNPENAFPQPSNMSACSKYSVSYAYLKLSDFTTFRLGNFVKI